MGFSTIHLVIFLVIVVLIFGTKKLKNIGQDLGSAVKGFKDGVKDGENSSDVKAREQTQMQQTQAVAAQPTATTSTASAHPTATTVHQVPPPVVEKKDFDTIDVESKVK